jgi:hypothetical protein
LASPLDGNAQNTLSDATHRGPTLYATADRPVVR